MDKITLEEAFKIRESLHHTNSAYTYGERAVIKGILSGSYDRYKNALVIVKEDIEFLDKDNDDYKNSIR
jgi:hypothetical protein